MTHGRQPLFPINNTTSTLFSGWGYVTLPNGIWNGALTWSECDDAIALHAHPSTDCTNIVEGLEVYNYVGHADHGESTAYGSDPTPIDDITAEDYDYAVDCGDFIF